jgi:hypothetical protein
MQFEIQIFTGLQMKAIKQRVFLSLALIIERANEEVLQ